MALILHIIQKIKTYTKINSIERFKMNIKRKYYDKNSAIEIFTIKNKGYFFNYKNEETQGD